MKKIIKKIIYFAIFVAGLVLPSLIFSAIDFTLDTTSVVTGTATGEVVGAFSDTDATYTFESGTGGEDNSKFTIDGNELKLNFTPDFTSPTDTGDTAGNNTYAIRVKVTKSTTSEEEIKNFIITVTRVPDNIAPVITSNLKSFYDITINPSYFEIPSVTCTDNVDGNIIPTVTENVNTSVLGTYTVVYDCEDFSGNTAIQKSVTINIIPENDLNLDVNLNLLTLKTGMPVGYTISNIVTSNVPVNKSVVYALVSGEGDDDNNLFEIDDNLLKIKFNPDYNTPQDSNADNAYSVRIQSKVSGSTVQKKFVIQVIPDDIILDDKYKCKGYGWSQGVGWVSLNCNNTASCSISDYGVNIENDSTLSGFAYSSNVSWLNVAPGNPYQQAKIINNSFKGQSVFVAGYGPNDGWDGVLSYSGNDGGVTSSGNPANKSYSVSRRVSGDLYGFAWSKNVVGWLGFPAKGKAECSNMLISFTTEGEDGLTPQTKIDLGDNLVLKWRTDGAQSCRALNGGSTTWTDDPIKSISVSGEWKTQTISNIVENTNFTLECEDMDGNKELRNLYVFVKPPEPQINFWATDTNIAYGTKAELNWNVEYARDCVASGSWNGYKSSAPGNHQEHSHELKDFPNYTFTLSCKSNNIAEYGNQVWSEDVIVDVAKLEVSLKAVKNPVPFNYPVEIVLDAEFAKQCRRKFEFVSGQNPLKAVPLSDVFDSGGYETISTTDYGKRWMSENVREPSEYKFTFECKGEFGQYLKKEVDLRVGNVPIYIED